MKNRLLTVSRRRAVTIVAGTAGFLLNPSLALSEGLKRYEWRGNAMGAPARIVFFADDEHRARRAIDASLAEIERLENQFSLYRKSSALARLNAAGELAFPALDMVDLLQTAKRLGLRTGGAFDVSIQPLWEVYARHFSNLRNAGAAPNAEEVEAARRLVDFRAIDVNHERIKLRPGMKITLNGIAQGYVTDRVSQLLKSRGWRHVLLDLGEIRSIGGQNNGDPWRVGIGGAGADGRAQKILEITDRAVATSAASGLRFDAEGRYHHLMNPKTGYSDGPFERVSVTAESATMADACSTAIATMEREEAADFVRGLKAAGDFRVWAAAPGQPMTRFDRAQA